MPIWDSTIWFAVGASALATLALAAAVLLALRLRRREAVDPESEQEAERAWHELERERWRSTRRRTELRWLRRLTGSAGTDSLEAVLRGMLEAAAEVGGAGASMLVLPQGHDEPLVATFGLTAEECSRELLGLPPSADARAVSLAYRYSEDEVAQDDFRLSGGLALPVPAADGGRVGTLAVLWRRVEHHVTEEELERLEGLAAALGPVLATAFHHEDLRRELDLDPVTDLKGRRFLQGALDLECARARRYEHPLALLLLHLPAPQAPDGVRTAAARLRAGVRAPDLVCHLGDGLFAALLPESSLGDGTRLYRRLELALGPASPGSPRTRLPSALVELRSEDDAVSLLQRAEATLAHAQADAVAGKTWSTAIEPGG